MPTGPDRPAFSRDRRPGDIVFAWAMLIAAAALLALIGEQTAHRAGAKLPTQPWFWPALSLAGMGVFGLLHLISGLRSDRLPGRWPEVGHWARSLEYAGWFLAYVLATPVIGYLPATLVFTLAMTARAGYRGAGAFAAAALAAVVIVVLFRAILQVRIPAGRVYEALPDGIRQVMMLYL